MSDEDIKRHFDVVAERIEKRFDLLAEAVQHLDSKIDRKTDALDRKLDELTVETRTGFRELGARIDVSVAQLSDRLATLEQSHSALEARVARLEAAFEQTS
ncbi:MAG TPA: hypothetical protein VGJ82_18835 [Thermoanaerobaculia bacterium]